VFGRWGNTPAPSFSSVQPATKSTNKPPSVASSNDQPTAEDLQATPKKPKYQYRPSGINQTGPIVGFFPEVKQRHPPIMRSLDEDALRKALNADK